ncbi:MAG: methylated-DNA--[protein]-cysteine S-methyltransferase [Phycisphaerales bacterium]|nr:methylated-DNA--[protein]-cysteine S-methyltransferase [Phycisphaerales bacterium]
MFDSSHRILKTERGRFAIFQSADGRLATGWLELLKPDAARRQGIDLESEHDHQLLPDLSDRLLKALAGEPVDFDDVPTPRGSAFQEACWNAARAIPRGEIRTYAQLASDSGHPRAARAVGQAMRHNPLPIIVPCHRVVSAAGLGGFAGEVDGGFGLRIKSHLLFAEGVDMGPNKARCVSACIADNQDMAMPLA